MMPARSTGPADCDAFVYQSRLSGQRDGMLRYMTKELGRTEESALPPEMMEDSSILRHIKTLTAHQTNAKQRRMDQYLRQVKHSQQNEEPLGAREPSKSPFAFGTSHEDVPKLARSETTQAPATQSSKTAPATKKFVGNLPQMNPRHEQRKTFVSEKQGRSRSKRKVQGDQQQGRKKRLKQAPPKQKIATGNSWARFRFGAAVERDNTSPTPTANANYHEAFVDSTQHHIKGESLPAVMTQAPYTCQHRDEAVRADPGSSKCNPSTTSTEQHAAEAYWGHEWKQFGATLTSTTSKTPWINSTQDVRFPWTGPIDSVEVGSALDTHESISVAFDPLSSMMASIYF